MESECELIPFLSDADVDRYGFSLISLIESFLTANHGSVVGFESEHDSAVRVLLAPEPSAKLLKQWSLVRAACMAFAEQMIASPAWNCVSDGMIRALTEPLLELCRDPAPVEASLLSQWAMDVGRDTSNCRYIASALVPKDFAKLLRARLARTPLADVYLSGPWLRGTVTASPIVWRAFANAIIGPSRARPQ
jgi:hypothetical protein